MGNIYAELTLKNEIDATFAKRGYIKPDEIRQMTVQAIVDTGAWTIVINKETCDKLGLDDKPKKGTGRRSRRHCYAQSLKARRVDDIVTTTLFQAG
jgi:hypothetical protein